MTYASVEDFGKDFVLAWQFDGIVVDELDWVAKLAYHRSLLSLGDCHRWHCDAGAENRMFSCQGE